MWWHFNNAVLFRTGSESSNNQTGETKICVHKFAYNNVTQIIKIRNNRNSGGQTLTHAALRMSKMSLWTLLYSKRLGYPAISLKAAKRTHLSAPD